MSDSLRKVVPMSTTTALDEILLRLDRAPSREPAARALLGWLEHSLARFGVRGDRADRARSRVACKLLELSRSARLAQIEDAEAYARQMIRRAVLDSHKEDQRHVGETSFDGERGERGGLSQDPTEPAAAEEKVALEASVDGCRDRARGLLQRAFAEVLAAAAVRYQAGLRATFEDLCALALDAASLRALLLRDGPVTEAAFAAAYKRHQRMRKSLREAIDALARAGRLTKREWEQALGCLSLLLRPGPKARVPGGRRPHTSPKPERPATALLSLEEKQRAPGCAAGGALRGAA